VSLDVGTDNQMLLDDPLYLGWRHLRLRGDPYDRFVEAFVEAVLEVFPRALLQWEDFKQHNAIRLLDRYRLRITCFNDDIQGTGGVVLAGLLSAMRLLGEELTAQRIVFLGAGAAGFGIARTLRAAMRQAGADELAVRRVITMLDDRGLVFESRSPLDDYLREFALGPEELGHHGFGTCDPEARYDLETVIRHVRPTILIGVSATAGAFTEAAIREMAAHVPTPVILPLSNPTSKMEAHPADLLDWTDGSALIATGSPVGSVEWRGRVHTIGQSNNAFVFPGLGLGVIVSEAREVPDELFLVAAETLTGCVDDDRLKQGALYPPTSALREVSRAIAIRVVREARDLGLGRHLSDAEIDPAVDAAMWYPDYASEAAA
jgi:malic enzyme